MFGNLISKNNSLYSTLRRMRIRLVLNYWMHINDINGKASYFHLIISVYYFWILICMYPLTFKMIDEVETIKRSGFCYCLHSAYIAFWDRQYYKFKKKWLSVSNLQIKSEDALLLAMILQLLGHILKVRFDFHIHVTKHYNMYSVLNLTFCIQVKPTRTLIPSNFE